MACSELDQTIKTTVRSMAAKRASRDGVSLFDGLKTVLSERFALSGSGAATTAREIIQVDTPITPAARNMIVRVARAESGLPPKPKKKSKERDQTTEADDDATVQDDDDEPGDDDDDQEEENPDDDEDDPEEDEDTIKMTPTKPGKRATAAEIEAYFQAEARRLAYQDRSLTVAQAYSRVVEANKALYDQYVRAK